MKKIADIRLFKKDKMNESMGSYFADKKLNACLFRIVMKLRENDFSLGDFDHLYIVFIPGESNSSTIMSVKVDRYFPLHIHCFIPLSKAFFDKLSLPDSHEEIISIIKDILVTHFSSKDFSADKIVECVNIAISQGENMLMKFKEKKTSKRKAVIYLRYTDNCEYYPLLKVFDSDDNLLYEKDMKKCVTLDCFGEIQLGLKKITIKPRKNSFTEEMSPLVFEYI